LKILLALVVGLAIGSDGQQTLRTCDKNNKNCNFSNKAEQNKQSFVCKKTVAIASDNSYYAEKIPKKFFLIKQGHKPLNQTELDSNNNCFEAVTVFQDYACENHPKVSLNEKAFMNSLHHQVAFVRNQEE